jgi:hypothetical protein
MPLVPHRFLLRIAHPCRYAKSIPHTKDERLLDLSDEYRIDNYAAIDGEKNFADVCLAWNEQGIGLQAEVRGKLQLPAGNPERPRGSDGVTLWLDTRDARTSHRGSRYCHQFHFLATGGGPEHDEPAFVQAKINRALEDAPWPRPAARSTRSTPRRAATSWKHSSPRPSSTATIRTSIAGSVFSSPCATTSWASSC